MGREPADLGRAGARRLRGVDSVDVETDVTELVTHDRPRLGHHLVWAAIHHLLDHEDPHAVGTGPLDVLTVIGRAADADLDHAAGVDQALLRGPAERRAVGEAKAAEI